MSRFDFAVIFVLGMSAGTACAQGSTGHRITDPNYIVTRTVSERIVAVNLKDSNLVLKDWDGKQHTVKVNKDTKFAKDTPAAELRNLHEGEMIRITYRAADSTALEIRLLAPAPKK